MSEINIENLNRLNCDWSDFADKRLMDIAKTHLSNKHREIKDDGDQSLSMKFNNNPY